MIFASPAALILAPTAALVLAPTALRAQVPPDAPWRTLRTRHFRIHYDTGLEALARHTAGRAEVAYAQLSTFAPPPDGRIDVVLSDHADYANGYATPLPSNRVYIFAKPPVDNIALSYFRDWSDLVLVHELTHVFHLDRTGAIGRLTRSVFGRLPFGWPVFPELYTPLWSIEGLAVEYETRFTGAGRNEGTFHDMIVRTAALEDRFAPIDRASSPDPVWPAGNHAYGYGSRFVEWLVGEYGAGAPSAVVRAGASAVLPPTLFFDRVGRRALGRSFTELWDAWRDDEEVRARTVADSLLALDMPRPVTLTFAGRYAFHPRVSPDGRTLAWGASTGRDEPATYVLRLGPDGLPQGAATRPRALAPRDEDGSEIGPASWLPDGSGLVTAGFEYHGPWRLWEDLWLVDRDGHRHRLTHGARLTEPDVSPDGRTVVAVRNGAGTTSLVTFDMHTGAVVRMEPPDSHVQWSLPRWSPDGTRIAVSRWSDGGDVDVVVLDAQGRMLARLTRDRAVDHGPAWSPDGRWVLFSSDRDGVPNLYAAPAPEPGASADTLGPSPGIRRVTAVPTGAFMPEVSPDGRTLWMVVYHADGWHVESLPFRPDTWTDAPAPLPKFRDSAAITAGDTAEDTAAGTPGDIAGGGFMVDADTVHVSGPGPYPLLETLRPRYWMPVLVSDTWTGTGIGAQVAGEDVVGRAAFAAYAAYAPSTGRVQGDVAFDWNGFGNPVLSFQLSRDWDRDAVVRTGDGAAADILARSDVVSVAATALRRGWRSFASATLGAEHVGGVRVVDSPNISLSEEVGRIRRWGVFGSLSASSARGYALSISPEDGAAATLGFRRQWDADPVGLLGEEYTELSASVRAYHDLRVFGFADHVLALRVAGLFRTGANAPLTDLGGAPGGAIGVGVSSIGASHFLPLRGLDPGDRAGNRGWAASLEYRLPLALVARGVHEWPVFLEDLSASAFLDAGDVWCNAERLASLPCVPAETAARRPITAAGAEAAADVSLFFGSPVRLRVGIARAVSGEPDARVRGYVAAGKSF